MIAGNDGMEQREAANGSGTSLRSARRRHMLGELVGCPSAYLRQVDPLEMNLLVARSLPGLSELEIEPYQQQADAWARDLRARLPGLEAAFHQTPGDWKNCVHFFRLGVLCWYVAEVLGVRYREDQREIQSILYTNPSDLFLNGVMDTRRGTCGNMAALHVAIAWRLGWPLSLACAGPHFFCRYDDGRVVHNIEATNNGRGGFQSHPDEYYQKEFGIPDRAVACGSDLRAVTPREMLGLFFGLRGRHWEDIGRLVEAEVDYLWARVLFPRNRRLYMAQVGVSVQLSGGRFEQTESGHFFGMLDWLRHGVTVRQPSLYSPHLGFTTRRQ